MLGCCTTHPSNWWMVLLRRRLSTVIITVADAVGWSQEGGGLLWRFRNIIFIWIIIILMRRILHRRLHHYHANWRNLVAGGFCSYVNFFEISWEVLRIYFLNTAAPSVTTTLTASVESERHFTGFATGLAALALGVGEATGRISRLLTVLFEWGEDCRIT